MHLNDFKKLIFTHAKSFLNNSEFEIIKAEELCESLNKLENKEMIFDDVALNLSGFDELKIMKNGYFGFKEFCEYVKLAIEKEVSVKANKSKIKFHKTHLSRLDEVRLLRNYFYKKIIKNLPKWFVEK